MSDNWHENQLAQSIHEYLSEKVPENVLWPLMDFLTVYISPGVIIWWLIVTLLFIVISLSYKKYSNSPLILLFDTFFEKIFDFFEDILGWEEKKWTKIYIVAMFFIILFSNLLWVILEFLIPVFDNILGEWVLHHAVSIPTADINFNVAMAIVWVIIVIYEQFAHMWISKALYEYFPFLWKGYIPYERWNLPAYIDWPLFLLIKWFDIIISVFLGLLEIIGHLAKIISLSFRLFWNVTSWGILLWMLYWALIGATAFLWQTVWGFPVIAPVILYFQELLVASIQALVFPLLIAIFIKVAKVH